MPESVINAVRAVLQDFYHISAEPAYKFILQTYGTGNSKQEIVKKEK